MCVFLPGFFLKIQPGFLWELEPEPKETLFGIHENILQEISEIFKTTSQRIFGKKFPGTSPKVLTKVPFGISQIAPHRISACDYCRNHI